MTEIENLERLEGMLGNDFMTWREVPLRHALFRRRSLRVDLLAVPRSQEFSDIAIGFEVKSNDHSDEGNLGKALKQASDYVLGSIEADRAELNEHAGKRVMAVFLWPSPQWVSGPREQAPPKECFCMGMMHLASHLRVGVARIDKDYREHPLVIALGQNAVWISSRGWRATARNQLVGKRQIGSQRFPILDELEAMSRGRK